MPRLRDYGVRLGIKKPSGRPFQKGHAKLGGRRGGTPNRATRDVREMFRAIFEDPAYAKSLRERILSGKAPTLEVLGFHYVFGKPREIALPEEDAASADAVNQSLVQVLASLPDEVLLKLRDAAKQRGREGISVSQRRRSDDGPWQPGCDETDAP